MKAGAADHGGPVLRAGLVLAFLDDPLESILAQNRTNRLQDLHGQRGMGVREAGMSRRGQFPDPCWPADAGRLAGGDRETLVSQPDKLLARGFAGRAEPIAEGSCSQRSMHLEQHKDALCRIAWRPAGIFQAFT